MSIYAVNGKEPVAAWIPSRDTVGNGTTTLHDLVGTNHGTLTNMDPATDWVISNGKTALDFDGLNDHVLMTPIRPSYVTASAWMNPSRLGNAIHGDGILCEGNNANDGIFEIMTIGSAIFFRVVRLSGSLLAVSPSGQFSTGEWSHVAIVYDGVTLSGYHNGQLAASSTSSASTLAKTGLGFVIGIRHVHRLQSSMPRFLGRLDDVRVFDQALTLSDIQYLYNNGNGRGIVASLRHPRIAGPDVVGSFGPVGRPRIVGPDVVGGLG